jgi:hypothetical protein
MRPFTWLWSWPISVLLKSGISAPMIAPETPLHEPMSTSASSRSSPGVSVAVATEIFV